MKKAEDLSFEVESTLKMIIDKVNDNLDDVLEIIYDQIEALSYYADYDEYLDDIYMDEETVERAKDLTDFLEDMVDRLSKHYIIEGEQ